MDKDLEIAIKRFHRKNVKADDTSSDKSLFPFLKTKEDPNPLFPILTKKDKITPLVPHLTEMVGVKQLFSDNLELLDNIRNRSIPGYSTYGELTANRLLRNPTQMNPSIDFLYRLRNSRLL